MNYDIDDTVTYDVFHNELTIEINQMFGLSKTELVTVYKKLLVTNSPM